jgi:hypothetical protein
MGPELRSGATLVHFGMHKTGTSSIQESLFQRLADPRFHYVNLGMANASTGISMCFRADMGGYGTFVKRGVHAGNLPRFREKAVGLLRAEMEACAKKIAIVSGENISQLEEAELRALHGFMAGRDRPVTAVAYVRRPKEYMESAFQQRVRGGLDSLVASKLYPGYRNRLEKFDVVYGRDNVQLWLFDPKRFPGGCVVQDFCARLGIAFRPEDAIRVNDGLSLPALSLLFAYRKFGPGFGVGPSVLYENRLLVNRIRTLPGPKLRLHSSLVAPVIAGQREDIEWMEARLGGVSLAEDLAAHDEGAIRSEEDLLRFSPEALRWLAEELGGERWRPDMRAQEVADWMHRLRVRLAAADEKVQKTAAGARRASITQPGKGDGDMTIEELIRKALQSAPALQALPEQDARALVREVFRHVRQQVDATDEGKIAVGGLGLFRIRQAEREKDGRTVPVKRVSFRCEKTGDKAE